jgi:hypothetical protein
MPKIAEFYRIYLKIEHHAAQAPALRERTHNFSAFVVVDTFYRF